MRSVIDFLAEMNTSLSLYHLISADLIRLLQNPLVSLRTELSFGPSAQGEGCRMLERHYRADSRGVFPPVRWRGLRPGPYSPGPGLGASWLVWGHGTPWQSDPVCCSYNTSGLGVLFLALLGPRFRWMVPRQVELRFLCFVGSRFWAIG